MAVRDFIRERFFPHIWCPGCGHGTTLNALLHAFDELGLDPCSLVMVSGIGCSARISGYVNVHSMHTLHGRALAFATGIKLARPDLNVVVPMGDGDATAIGGNHFIHAARRNINLTAILMNNRIYGMTGGQYSPMSGAGTLATTAPYGNIDRDFDAVKLAEGAGATFVARSTTYHVKELCSLLKKAILHKACSVVEVMGRHCGDIALKAAAGSGAEICLVPEVPWSIQEAADRLSRLIDMGNPRATVVVAEGAWDSMQPADWRRYLIENGAKGIHEDDPISTEKLALLLKYKCKCEARPTVLGYTQRGRTPSAYDSWFAFEAGNLAVNLLRNGIGNQVIGIKDGRVYYLPIIEALKQKREFNLSLYNMINSL